MEAEQKRRASRQADGAVDADGGAAAADSGDAGGDDSCGTDSSDEETVKNPLGDVSGCQSAEPFFENADV